MNPLYVGVRVQRADDDPDEPPTIGTLVEPTEAERAAGFEEAGTDVEIMAFVAWSPTYRRWEYVDDIRPV